VTFGALDDAVDDGAEEPFLAAEIVLDRGQVDVGALGQVARARSLVALGGKDLERGRENAAPRILAAGLRARPVSRDSVSGDNAY
jgi:hypothetical protein